MGASQSTIPEPQITEKLTERLRAMQLENEKDYMMVEKVSAKRSLLHNSISFSTSEKWLEDVLADPKVRYVTGTTPGPAIPTRDARSGSAVKL
jgi:hypothetical protein